MSTLPDWSVTLAFALQVIRYYLLRPLFRLVKYVLDWGARNFWFLVFLLGVWFYTLEKRGAFSSPEGAVAELLAKISFGGFSTTVAEAFQIVLCLIMVVWIYREVRGIFWDLGTLAKRWIARVLLISLYLLYRFWGQESEAVYYLGGPPTLKERLMVYGAMGAAALMVCGIGYLEIAAALPPL